MSLGQFSRGEWPAGGAFLPVELVGFDGMKKKVDSPCSTINTTNHNNQKHGNIQYNTQ